MVSISRVLLTFFSIIFTATGVPLRRQCCSVSALIVAGVIWALFGWFYGVFLNILCTYFVLFSIPDASTITVAQGCGQLTSLNVWSCENLTGASIIAVAQGCGQLASLARVYVKPEGHIHHECDVKASPQRAIWTCHGKAKLRRVVIDEAQLVSEWGFSNGIVSRSP